MIMDARLFHDSSMILALSSSIGVTVHMPMKSQMQFMLGIHQAELFCFATAQCSIAPNSVTRCTLGSSDRYKTRTVHLHCHFQKSTKYQGGHFSFDFHSYCIHLTLTSRNSSQLIKKSSRLTSSRKSRHDGFLFTDQIILADDLGSLSFLLNFFVFKSPISMEG